MKNNLLKSVLAFVLLFATSCSNETVETEVITTVEEPVLTPVDFSGKAATIVKIRNAQSTYYLDVRGPSTNSGANIHQWSGYESNSQRWSIISTGDSDNAVIIKNIYSGKVLDVEGRSTTSGANVHQYKELTNNSDNQKWIIYDVGSSDGYIIASRNGGKRLQIKSNARTNGVNVLMQSNNGNKNQKWKFE